MGDRRTHLANERTFLAWIRTSVSIMGFGFVVEKFSLFLWLDKRLDKDISSTSLEISNLLGVIFIGLGAIMGFLAMLRFVKVEKEIETNTFRPPVLLDIMCGLIFLVMSILILYYIADWHSILLLAR
ncbi:MAG: DUF202 domain-containing protein [Thermodesulfobacteria bacterium]|nr:DUF202 domain-containing protein [Thermodesulfobacteriota bacterium]